MLYFEIFVDLTGKELFNWCEEVNPTKFYNSEKYIDYIDIFLVKVAKLFKEKQRKREKKTLQIYVNFNPLRCWSLFFIIFSVFLSS